MEKYLLIGFAVFMGGFIVGLAMTQEYNAKKYERIYIDLRRNDLQILELEKAQAEEFERFKELLIKRADDSIKYESRYK
jgi:hypothetical protein